MGYSQQTLDKYRHINVGDSYWYECILEEFIEDMKQKGTSIFYDYRGSAHNHTATPRIYFSGFWSQGDGAFFEGELEDLEKFLEAHEINDKSINNFVKLGGTINLSCAQAGHYYNVRFDSEYTNIEDLAEENSFYATLAGALVDEKDIIEFCDETAPAIFRRHTDDLYKRLENEYSYQTSDEAVSETLEANGAEEEQEEEEGGSQL